MMNPVAMSVITNTFTDPRERAQAVGVWGPLSAVSLANVPDYPSRLHVEYPQSLACGLVLVKWWLLALPHPGHPGVHRQRLGRLRRRRTGSGPVA